jgi:hypothetical protein
MSELVERTTSVTLPAATAAAKSSIKMQQGIVIAEIEDSTELISERRYRR